MVVPAARALANGLCFFAFYSEYGLAGRIAASAVADISWLVRSPAHLTTVPRCRLLHVRTLKPSQLQVEEAGLSLYSYLVLIPILSMNSRVRFRACYWCMVIFIAASKLAILALRVRYLLTILQSLLRIIDHLHIVYFCGIALVEILSAALLLKQLKLAHRISPNAALCGGLFKYLMRSTEIHVALLCLIGVSRSVSYSFQVTAQSATTIAGEFDRFAATLEIMLPVTM